MFPEVDKYLSANPLWQKEMQALREIVLSCGLTEELKWRVPCYTHQGGNVVMISALKEYCALSFSKGALLKDSGGILSTPGKNTRSARLIRFTGLEQIIELQSRLKSYIHEAIALEDSGSKVDFEKDRTVELPKELEDKFASSPELKTAFQALTPGRQRGYLLFFSAAKQASTRVARIEKHVQRILDGKGILDCTCKLSRKMPNCDGSHKLIGDRAAEQSKR